MATFLLLPPAFYHQPVPNNVQYIDLVPKVKVVKVADFAYTPVYPTPTPEPIVDTPQASPTPQAAPVAPTGGCLDWIRAAGITDEVSAYALLMDESGCNPNAVNRSSGACGLGQQLPCGKWAHQWNDPVGALIDTQQYVFATYGSWASALAHERIGWY